MQQVSARETEYLLALAHAALFLEGDFVEFGCYRGDTSILLAKSLQKARTTKRLWVYDSFEGLPERSAQDASVAGEAFQAGKLKVSKREVVERFKKAGVKAIVKKGFFEDLTESDLPKKISFGFLDGDFYQSIKTSLKLTAGKVAKNGILAVHDYNNPELPGVTQAVDEWLQQNRGSKIDFAVRESLAILKFLN